jgi:hypothetical protein
MHNPTAQGVTFFPHSSMHLAENLQMKVILKGCCHYKGTGNILSVRFFSLVKKVIKLG